MWLSGKNEEFSSKKWVWALGSASWLWNCRQVIQYITSDLQWTHLQCDYNWPQKHWHKIQIGSYMEAHCKWHTTGTSGPTAAVSHKYEALEPLIWTSQHTRWDPRFRSDLDSSLMMQEAVLADTHANFYSNHHLSLNVSITLRRGPQNVPMQVFDIPEERKENYNKTWLNWQK